MIYQDSKTGNTVGLQLVQQVLLHVHEARKELNDVTELIAADKDSKIIARKVSATSDKLRNVHNYLLQAFDAPMEVVLHKAQVKVLIIMRKASSL